MSVQQVLVVAIPVLGAVFVFFVVLLATSRRGPSEGEGTEDVGERFAAALDAVPGGVVQETSSSAGTDSPRQSKATATLGEQTKVRREPGIETKDLPATAGVITQGYPTSVRLNEGPSGDGHKEAAIQVMEPIIELKPVEPSDEETEGMTRRQVLNRGILLTIGASLTSFGGAILAFLWPKLSGGFGSVIAAGNIDEIKNAIRANKEPFYSAAGRFYLMTYESNLDEATGEAIYPKAFSDYKQAGLIAMYQKCPHLGCKVPWCKSSQWFECPCHGSKYNAAGEWQGGPAPRGMWHFPIKIQGGTVLVDTGNQITGPPKGTNTPVDPLAKGPHCVGI